MSYPMLFTFIFVALDPFHKSAPGWQLVIRPRMMHRPRSADSGRSCDHNGTAAVDPVQPFGVGRDHRPPWSVSFFPWLLPFWETGLYKND
jgi:hypothetical protein